MALQVEQLGGADNVSRTPLCHIPHPKPAAQQPSLQQLGSLARLRMQAQTDMAAESGFHQQQPGPAAKTAHPPQTDQASKHMDSQAKLASQTGTLHQTDAATCSDTQASSDTSSQPKLEQVHAYAECPACNWQLYPAQELMHSQTGMATQPVMQASILRQTDLPSLQHACDQADIVPHPGLQRTMDCASRLSRHDQTDSLPQPGTSDLQYVNPHSRRECRQTCHSVQSPAHLQMCKSDASIRGQELCGQGVQAALWQPSLLPVSKHGDAVLSFGEAAAAEGFLGRFPGSEVMPLIQQFIGM